MNSLFLKRCACIVTLILSLAALGCGTKQSASKSEEQPLSTLDIEAREAKLKAFKPWRANGTIALESEAQGKFNVSFAWDVDEQGYDIKLFGPLGVQVYQLTQTSNSARLVSRSDSINGINGEQLLSQALGVPVPISEMQTWAVGLPGDASQVERDQSGRLETMEVEQGGTTWDVEFDRYRVMEELDLPRTVLIESDGISIKMDFKKWARAEAADNNRLSIPGVGT